VLPIKIEPVVAPAAAVEAVTQNEPILEKPVQQSTIEAR